MKNSFIVVILFIISILTTNCLAQSLADSASTPCPNCITEDYLIPSYNLYQQDWNHDHIRLKSLGVSLGDNADIKIILVENDNSPFSMPCRDAVVTSNYGHRKGQMHSGVDLDINLNDSIFSCFDGVVRMAKNYGAYGNVVVIRHYNGLETVYAHLNTITVQSNERVKAGQVIGFGGHSGRTSGDHLHFETRFLYEHFNPAKMIDFEEEELNSNVLTISKKEFESVAAEENETQNTTDPNVSYHTVKPGETLSAIGRKYNIPLQKLYSLNNLTETSTLQIGQKIRLK